MLNPNISPTKDNKYEEHSRSRDENLLKFGHLKFLNTHYTLRTNNKYKRIKQDWQNQTPSYHPRTSLACLPALQGWCVPLKQPVLICSTPRPPSRTQAHIHLPGLRWTIRTRMMPPFSTLLSPTPTSVCMLSTVQKRERFLIWNKNLREGFLRLATLPCSLGA